MSENLITHILEEHDNNLVKKYINNSLLVGKCCRLSNNLHNIISGGREVSRIVSRINSEGLYEVDNIYCGECITISYKYADLIE